MIAPLQQLNRWRWQIVGGLVIAAALVVCILFLAHVWPIGPDYYFTFQRTAQMWLHGETRLYDSATLDSSYSNGFFNAPWTLILLVPLSLLPLQIGEAVLNVGSLVGILLCIRALALTKPIPVYAIALAMANLHSFDVLLRGEIDVVPLLGVVLGWWAVQTRRPLALSLALALMAVKPVNVVLPALVLLLAIRDWRLADKLK